MKDDFILEKYNTLPENLQNEVLGFIDFLSSKYNKIKKEELTPEIKNFLTRRKKHHEENPQNAISWDEFEKQLEAKYGYEI